MKVADETRVQWLRRQWHLHAASLVKEYLLPGVMFAVLLAFIFGLESALRPSIEFLGGRVRTHLPPLLQHLLLGIGCGTFGLLLVRSELRKSGPWTFLRARILFGGVGLTIWGTYFLLKASWSLLTT